MKIPNCVGAVNSRRLSLARIVSEDSQLVTLGSMVTLKSSKDS